MDIQTALTYYTLPDAADDTCNFVNGELSSILYHRPTTRYKNVLHDEDNHLERYAACRRWLLPGGEGEKIWPTAVQNLGEVMFVRGLAQRRDRDAFVESLKVDAW